MLGAAIFGVDIYPHYRQGSPKSRRYALTILKDGEVAEQHRKVSRSHLLHLIRIWKPTFLAVDNVYELAQDVNSLKNFFSRLPDETRVIQVTGFQAGVMDLQKTASIQGLKPPWKSSPIEESEACARLVDKGFGAEVQLLENEAKILVCRNIRLGSGGSSQTRYRRRIHTSILNMKKKIEEALQSAGLDYDLFIEESDFGLERAYFHVYASRSRLNDLIKQVKGRYVRVKISPVYRNKIKFVPLSSKVKTRVGAGLRPPEKNLIIGIDPGTNCGLAILSLDASPLYLKSRKALTRGEITRIVMDYGSPLIVASDVKPAPEFVRKLAKMLNSVLFVPESVLEASEKREITRDYAEKFNVKMKNPHIRDALAAAIKAFQHYKNKFKQAEGEVRKLNSPVSPEEVKALVVRGQPIQRAIELLSPKKAAVKVERLVETGLKEPTLKDLELKMRRLQKKLSFYREQVKQLKKANESLIRDSRALERRLKSLEDALEVTRREDVREIRRQREYQLLKREIDVLKRELARERDESQKLRERLDTLRRYRSLESRGEVVLLKPVETFTKDGLERAYQLYDIKPGDTILLLNSSGGGASTAEEIVRRGVRTVVSKGSMAHQAEEVFEKYGVVVVHHDDLNIEWIEGYPYIKSEELSSAIKRELDSKKIVTDEKMIDILEEYKRERESGRG